MSDDDLDEMYQWADSQVEEALEFAEESEQPDPEELYLDVLAATDEKAEAAGDEEEDWRA